MKLPFKSVLTSLLMVWFALTANGQSSLTYTDNYKTALDIAKNQDKLVYAVYTEDDPLKEAYLSYLSFNDSLSILLDSFFVLYVEESDYNSVEISSAAENVLAILELNTEVDTLYQFIKRITDNISSVRKYLVVENQLLSFEGISPPYLDLLTYLTCAKDVLQLKKGVALDLFIGKCPTAELSDGRHLDLIAFHTTELGKGYELLKQYRSARMIKDSTSFSKIKSILYDVLVNTYDNVIRFDEIIVTEDFTNEIGWFINNFESQSWNSRYRYMRSKFNVASKKKGDKTLLFQSVNLFVQNWIINQIQSDAPFMAADEIGYDLVSAIDILLKRKIDKELYPEMEPWILEALRILPGFQSNRAYAEWLKRVDRKDESKIENNKFKVFRSQLPKATVKAKEEYLKENLDPHQVLLDFCDAFLLYKEEWEL